MRKPKCVLEIKTFFADKDHWLYQPNPIYGFFLYAVLSFLALFRYRWIASLQFYVVLIANFGSIYLGYILYFVLQVGISKLPKKRKANMRTLFCA